jgi:hypothetical protein
LSPLRTLTDIGIEPIGGAYPDHLGEVDMIPHPSTAEQVALAGVDYVVPPCRYLPAPGKLFRVTREVISSNFTLNRANSYPMVCTGNRGLGQRPREGREVRRGDPRHHREASRERDGACRNSDAWLLISRGPSSEESQTTHRTPLWRAEALPQHANISATWGCGRLPQKDQARRGCRPRTETRVPTSPQDLGRGNSSRTRGLDGGG